jgi:DNA-binding SARP family transcriptional activator/tetratricopeptide (TPR) repeat protein
VEFGLLGTVAVRHEGRDVVIGSAQQRCVLAVLLLDAGRVVPTERLIGVLWDGDDVPKTARNVLQGCVSDLRRALDVPLVHRSAGYVIEVDPDRIDLVRFRTLVAQANSTDGQARATVLRRALALWRGEPLTDVEAPGLAAVKHALAEERLSVLEETLGLELRLGRHNDLVPELTALVGAHPLRERPHGLLMLALHRAGRPSEALQAFLDARRVLRDEVGADPGPELVHLHQQILRADPALDRAGETDRAVVPRQLPPAPAVFSGRLRELTALTTAPDAETVVISAIGGFGGVGKTWLALHWAHRNLDRFPDGQLFVNLRGFDPGGEPLAAADAVRGFLDALGVTPGAIPADPQAQAGLYRSLIADKRMLVLLDNARDTAHVTPLLPGTPSCTVVITSRDRMRGLATANGARNLTLDVLSEAEARDLLTRRLGPQRVLREAAAVAELLAHCAGMPLALGIVVGRATAHPDFPLSVLAVELRDTAGRLGALDTGDPTTSLATVLSWSCAALAPREAEVFGLLGLAPGPDISLAAAAHLTGLSTSDIRGVLRTLDRVSLVDEHAPGRYRMHDLVRLYAAERAGDDAEPAVRRLVDFYLRTAFAGDRLLSPHRRTIGPLPAESDLLSDEAAAMEWFDAEHRNVLAAQQFAADRGWHTEVGQFAWALDTFHFRQGLVLDLLAVWRHGLAAAERLDDPEIQALAHRSLGHSYARVEEYADALAHLRQALALYEHTGELFGQASTHRALAWTWGQQGDNQRALEHATHTHRLFEAIDEPVMGADSLNALGWLHAQLGRYAEAREHCENALARFRDLEHRLGQADALDSLGVIARHTGRYADAVTHHRQALALFRDIGDVHQAADTLEGLGHGLAALGRQDEARASWREALELYRSQDRGRDADRVLRQLDQLKVG